MYAEALAETYANASSTSSSILPSPRRNYDPRVRAYFELSASKYEDI